MNHMSHHSPLLSKDEEQMVKDYIVLSILLTVLDHEIERLPNMKLKLLPLYIKQLHCIQQQIIKDLTSIKAMLRKIGIKIYEQSRTENGIQVAYVCRGYHHSFEMLWRLLKAEVVIKMSSYLHVPKER
ncbi:hypothetical protein EJF36_16715 [Bacillus sp. HMF5848]|uniref:hypothetical protein n=1 Tax=Bacillus sp. HMF5848 TaxID=2495421 RepID=UPI000F7B6247|nr:hypothetical protein [Bacillus sp. HMF5848]RSK28374.1 hypothetical protein EJF36_16715 [Bacillus sp. HMF5848]